MAWYTMVPLVLPVSVEAYAQYVCHADDENALSISFRMQMTRLQSSCEAVIDV